MSRDAASHNASAGSDASFIFDPSAFYKARFDPEDFIGSYVIRLHDHSTQKQSDDGPLTVKSRHERLLFDLKRCEARFSAQFIELLNTEYASFIGLSQSLDGVLPAVEQISSRSEALYTRISRAQPAARAVLARVKRTHITASCHHAQTAYLTAAEGLWAECDILDDILPSLAAAPGPSSVAPASTFSAACSSDDATSLLLASVAGDDTDTEAFAAYLMSASCPVSAPQNGPESLRSSMASPSPTASAAEAATASAMVLLQANHHLSRADELAASAALQEGPSTAGDEHAQLAPGAPALAAAVAAQRARLLAASERFHAAAADALARAIPSLAEAWSLAASASATAPLAGPAFELLRACRLLVTAFLSAPLPRCGPVSGREAAPAVSRDQVDAQARARAAARQAAAAHLVAAGLFRRPLRKALCSVVSAPAGGASVDRFTVSSRLVDMLGSAADAAVGSAVPPNGGRESPSLERARGALVVALVAAVESAAPLLALLCRGAGGHDADAADGDGAPLGALLAAQAVVADGVWPEVMLALHFASGNGRADAGAGSKPAFRSVWAAALRPRAALAHFSVLRSLATGLATASFSWCGDAREAGGAHPGAADLSARLMAHPAAQSLVAGWGLRLAHSQSYAGAASEADAASRAVVALSQKLVASAAALPEASSSESSSAIGSLIEGTWAAADAAAGSLFATPSSGQSAASSCLLPSTAALMQLQRAALAPELVPPELAAAGVAAVAAALSASSVALSAAAAALPGAVLKGVSAWDVSAPPPDIVALSAAVADVGLASSSAPELDECRVPTLLPAGAPPSAAVWRTALVGALSLCANAQAIAVDVPLALAGSSAGAAAAAATGRLVALSAFAPSSDSVQRAVSAASLAAREAVQRMTAVSRHRAAAAAWRSLIAVASAAATAVETAASAIVAEAMRSIRDRSGGARPAGPGPWVQMVVALLDDVAAAAAAAAASPSLSLRARAPFPMPPADAPGAAAPAAADLQAAFTPFFSSLCHTRNADGSASVSAHAPGGLAATVTSLCALSGGDGQAPGPTALALVLWLLAQCLAHAVPAATARGIQSVLTLQASLSGSGSSADGALTLTFSSASRSRPLLMSVPRTGSAFVVASQFVSDAAAAQGALARAKNACLELTGALHDSFGAELLNGLTSSSWVGID